MVFQTVDAEVVKARGVRVELVAIGTDVTFDRVGTFEDRGAGCSG